MTVPLIAENWGALLEPGLRAVFFKEFDGTIVGGSRIPLLFDVQGSTKAAETDQGVGAFGNVPEYNGAIAYDSFAPGYATTFTHREYALGTKIERKLWDDEMYGVMNRRVRELANSFARTREIHAADQFNNAFSASFLGADGKALCATDHPAGPNSNGAAAMANRGTNALDAAGIKASRLAMRKWTDDRGNLNPAIPDILLVPPDLEQDALVLLNTTNKVGSADNDLNEVRTYGLTLVVWDFLSDTNNWFLIDSRKARIHNLWFDRSALEFASDPTSDYKLMARYRGYMRYSFGWDDWAWLYGNIVA